MIMIQQSLRLDKGLIIIWLLQFFLMLGKGLQPGLTASKSMKKSIYQEIEEKDFHRLLDERDQTIRKLQYKIDKLQKENEQLTKAQYGEGNMQSFYKQKLEDQIQTNEVAIQLILNMSHRIFNIIQLLKIAPDLCQDSSEVKNILKVMGGQTNMKIDDFSLDESDPQSIEAIETDVKKRMDQLEIICDAYHKSFTKMQKEYSGIESKLKEQKKNWEQQVKTLEKDLKQQRKSREHLQILLQKNEKQKEDIVNSINNVLDPKIRKQVQKMTRDDLLAYLKKLMFRVTELETSKCELIKENTKVRANDLEKYKKILSQVKEVKVGMSRMGQSVM